MSKLIDANSKKSLVRHPEKPLPKFKLMTGINSRPTTSGENGEQVDKKICENVENSKNKFDYPELYSSLKLSKNIDQILKPRKTKSCSDVVNKQLAIDERISRKVNFPYSQPIYKGLIPLTCSQTPHQPVATLRDPILQKDREPLLSDFIIPKSMPNYYCLPCVKLDIEPTLIANNNLRLYNNLEIYRNIK